MFLEQKLFANIFIILIREKIYNYFDINIFMAILLIFLNNKRERACCRFFILHCSTKFVSIQNKLKSDRPVRVLQLFHVFFYVIVATFFLLSNKYIPTIERKIFSIFTVNKSMLLKLEF